MLAEVAAGVKFGRADAIAVAAYNFRAFFGYGADFCHIKTEATPQITIWYHVFYRMQIDAIFQIIILIISVVLHEVAHGYMANYLGDPTARLAGRLTLNPISHIDLFGSILLPGLLVLSGTPFIIGYAKPVPYNPYNLRGKYGEALVAFAGPGTNILLALIFGLLLRFGAAAMSPAIMWVFVTIVLVNLSLAIINLIPIPPIDGSKILSGILGFISPSLERGYDTFRANFERLGILSGMVGLLVVLYLFRDQFYWILTAAFYFLTGL